MAGSSSMKFPVSGIRALMEINREVASLIGQVCAFRPEVSLLIELYVAQKQNQRVDASALGLASGITRATAIRWLRYLEEQGWVTCLPDENDQLMRFPQLTSSMFKQLDTILRQCDRQRKHN